MRFGPAKLAATNAQREYRGLVDARVLVDTAKTSSGTTLYRSRLIGLSHDEADAACQGLKQLGTACLVTRLAPAVLAEVPRLAFRELPDPDGDLATHLVVVFPDAASARAVAAAARRRAGRRRRVSPRARGARRCRRRR